jgi:glycosyltransferase involved in cell wall biosynthesis
MLPYRRLFWLWDCNAKLVTTFHGAPWTEDWYTESHPAKLFITKYLLNKFDAIITVSNHAKDVLSENLDIPRNIIHVVHNAPPPSMVPELNQQTLSKHDIDGDYILHLSNGTKRKNPEGIIRGYSYAVKNLDVNEDLVIAGGRWSKESFTQYLDDGEIKKKINFIGFVPRDDLPTLYHGAEFLFMPSFSESCSIAQLEAMACGTTVLATNAAGMPEVSGDSAVYVDDPMDIREIGEKILTTLQNSEDLGEKALDVAQSRTWEDVADETITVYNDIL